MRFIAVLVLLVATAAPAQVDEAPLGYEAVFDGINTYPVIARAVTDGNSYFPNRLMVQVDGDIIFMDYAEDYPPHLGFRLKPLTVEAAEVPTEVCNDPGNLSEGAVCNNPMAVAIPMFISGLGYHDCHQVDLLWDVDGTVYSYNQRPTRFYAVDRSGPEPVGELACSILQLWATPFDAVTHHRLLEPGLRIVAKGPYSNVVPEPSTAFTLPMGAAWLAGLSMMGGG